MIELIDQLAFIARDISPIKENRITAQGNIVTKIKLKFLYIFKIISAETYPAINPEMTPGAVLDIKSGIRSHMTCS